jgi:hypothetical protein
MYEVLKLIRIYTLINKIHLFIDTNFRVYAICIFISAIILSPYESTLFTLRHINFTAYWRL